VSVAGTRTIAGTSGIPSSQSAASESPHHLQLSSFAENIPSPAKAVHKAETQKRKMQQDVTLLQRRIIKLLGKEA
jgi:hypothetical protein